MAQLTKAARAFRDLYREQGLAVFAQCRQLGDMAQAIEVDIGPAEDGDHLFTGQLFPGNKLFQTGERQCAGRFRDRTGVFKDILHGGTDLVDAD